MNRKFLHPVLSLSLLFIGLHTEAANYELDEKQGSLIGTLQITRSEYEDTLLDIARANGLGYHDIKLVNPDIDTWLPGEGEEIILPSQFILPHASRKGIILNIPEMRLYYFRRQQGKPLTVFTYPLGVGREGWDTPYMKTRIIQKKKNPYWYPPKSIREEHAEQGDPLPRRVSPGPDNPLGKYALRLGVPQYLIHGTNKPYGIGMRVSHGCIRLYPEDIEQLFSQIDLGTPVHIINQPYKVGHHQGRIFLEAHPYLQEDAEQFQDNLTSMIRILVELTGESPYELDWDLAKQVIHEMKGVPIEVGRFVAATTQAEIKNSNIGHNLDLRLETSLEDY